jgi:hypothetical protein
MLLFRSEAHVTSWLAGRSPGATIPITQLAALANAWWGDRVSPDWQPHTRAQNQEILDRLGLTGPFWFGALEQTGAIAEVADSVEGLTDGNRTAELLGITWIAATGSAVVDNIPFTTAMIPVVEQLGGGEDDAYWWALSLGACFGGNATIIAAAANVAAAGLTERAGKPIGFMTFLRIGVPVTMLTVVLASLYITVRYIA